VKNGIHSHLTVNTRISTGSGSGGLALADCVEAVHAQHVTLHVAPTGKEELVALHAHIVLQCYLQWSFFRTMVLSGKHVCIFQCFLLSSCFPDTSSSAAATRVRPFTQSEQNEWKKCQFLQFRSMIA